MTLLTLGPIDLRKSLSAEMANGSVLASTLGMKRTSKAIWQGNLKSGAGKVSTGSGAIEDFPYSFSTRFENNNSTNPEELIAAAHAASFSLALVAELEKSGLSPMEIRTTATVSLEKGPDGWHIDEVHLITSGSTELNAGGGGFLLAANRARANCPISKLLKTQITLEVVGVQPELSP